MSTPINTILSWFETGDFPTQEQFAASWTSFHHKDDQIPYDKIEGLTNKLAQKADKNVYEAHLSNTEAHTTTLAKLDGSNLNDINIQAWKTILGVGNLPTNIATVDEGTNIGNVFTKNQSQDQFMKRQTFVNNEGKILANMIESLGLTEIITVVETSLAAFIGNNSAYQFQKNDFIGIPNGSGNYSLYLYKGGDKAISGNYIPTGLTNITISMVEGLQSALNQKIDSPLAEGSYMFRLFQGNQQWKLMNIATGYFAYWNGIEFVTSNIFTDGSKIGLGTNSPSEALHVNGRTRAKAFVAEENTEILPNQLTLKNRRWSVTDLTGNQNQLMYLNYADYETLVTSFTTAQKDRLGQIWGNQYSNGSLNVYSITPTVMLNDHTVKYLVLQGLNMNVNPASTSVKFIPVGNAVGIGEVDCLGFQTSSDGKTMTVSIYGDSLAPGKQYNIIIRTTLPNAQTHRTTGSINVVTSIGNIDVSTLTWQKKAITPGQEDQIFMTNGGNFAYNASTSNRAFAYEPNTIVGTAKSSVIFGANTNFYLDINVSLSIVAGGIENVYDFFGYLGLMSSNVSLDLIDSTFIRLIATSLKSGGYQGVAMYNDVISVQTKQEGGGTVMNGNLIIMRTGNAYSQFLIFGNTMISQTKISTTDPVSLYLGSSNAVTKRSISASIAQAFTF